MQTPALMFGIGATRGGTTWLYRYLRRHPQCHLRGVKELHWFNTHEAGRFQQRLRVLGAARARVAGDLARAGDSARAARLRARLDDHDTLIALTQARADHAAYLRWLEDGRGPEARLVGDITPAYGLLSEASLRLMAGLRPVVRFVLILRDPLRRLWSNILQSEARRGDAAALPERARAAMRRFLDGDNPAIAARADYAGMLTRLDRALAPGALHVAFHERLFSPDGIAALCAFLGLEPRPAPLERRVHSSADIPLDPALADAARARLEPQYAFMRNRFGGDLPAEWDAHTAKGLT